MAKSLFISLIKSSPNNPLTPEVAGYPGQQRSTSASWSALLLGSTSPCPQPATFLVHERRSECCGRCSSPSRHCYSTGSGSSGNSPSANASSFGTAEYANWILLQRTRRRLYPSDSWADCNHDWWMGAECHRLSIFRAHMVSKRLLIFWHRETFIVIINCWTDFQREQFKARGIYYSHKQDSEHKYCVGLPSCQDNNTMFDRGEKSDPDWSRVDFPCSFYWAVSLRVIIRFTGAGTYWAICYKDLIYTLPLINERSLELIMFFSRLKLRYCLHMRSDVGDSKLPA